MAYSRTILVGNVTQNPELRVTPNGKSVCSFTVAVKRRMQDVTDFHDCVAWGNTAEAISKHFHKGKEILVEGELQKRNYVDKEGIKRYATELKVDTFSFVGRKDDARPVSVEVDEPDEDLPF